MEGLPLFIDWITLMPKLALSMAVAASTVLLSGCLTTKMKNISAEGGKIEQHKTSHYMGGFGQATVVPSCSKAKSIKDGQTFGDGMLSAVTIGILNRRTVEVECAQ